MREPRVTIGLPVYNGGSIIERSLRSVLDQSYEDFEIVVSDNGSTDNTIAEIERIADGDPRVRILRSERNHGAAWNYNNAFHHARGEFFRWHADDDWLEPDLLVRLVEALDADSGAVLAHTYTRFVDDDGHVVREYRDDLGVTSTEPYERLGSIVRRLSFCNAVFGLIRTDVLARTPLIAPFPGSDVPLLYELAVNGRFVVVPEFLFSRRPGNSLKTNTTTQSVAEWFSTDQPRARFVGAQLAKATLTGIVRAPDLSYPETARTAAEFARVWPIDYARRIRRRARRRSAATE